MVPTRVSQDEREYHLKGVNFLERQGIMGKRKIKANDVARDVHAGMGDTLLMEKYSLSAKQLEGVLKTLVDADLITHMQLYERTSLSDSLVTRAFVEAKKAIKELD